MGKIPTDHSASSTRYNPMARPPAPRANPPTVPWNPPTPPHERPEGGLQSDGHSMSPSSPLGHSATPPRPTPQEPHGSGSGPVSPGTAAADDLINWAMGPDDPFGLNRPPDSPGTQALRRASDLEGSTGIMQSKWNGFKPMSPHVQEAIPQFDQRFPDNIHGITRENPMEYGQVFHDLGMGRLHPGIFTSGTENSVDVPADIHQPTARVNVHSHPYTGRHFSGIPSMGDQLAARANPQVEHIVQIPAPNPGEANVYLTYSGAVPPRHYTLVPNPGNLPVPPPSPDGHSPFHPMPGEGSGSGAGRE